MGRFRILLPVLLIVIFEYFTDIRVYIVEYNFQMIFLTKNIYSIVILLFFILYTKKSLVRVFTIILLSMVILPDFMVMIFFMNQTLIHNFSRAFFRLNLLIVNYDFKSIFMLVFFVSTGILAVRKRSLFAIIVSLIAIGIYLYQWRVYQYPLFNDPFEEVVYAIEHNQLTSLRYSLTYISLLILPIFLGFLSLELKKE
ncbi:MAG: hypothetical protein KQ78_02078 [Candidatus Izimaplasma bacterium HR2]|nr:MAG: hypothetical protein KQ78_02078 [Candidatus Izimaplasma bacterium HR2]